MNDISCFHYTMPTCEVLKKAGAAKLFVMDRLDVLPAIAIRAVLRIRCIHTVFVAAISTHKRQYRFKYLKCKLVGCTLRSIVAVCLQSFVIDNDRQRAAGPFMESASHVGYLRVAF